MQERLSLLCIAGNSYTERSAIETKFRRAECVYRVHMNCKVIAIRLTPNRALHDTSCMCT